MGAQTWGQTGEVGFSARGYGDPVCAFLSLSLSFSLRRILLTVSRYHCTTFGMFFSVCDRCGALSAAYPLLQYKMYI